MGWRPQPGPQKILIDCPVYEIFYGGARGGGKTDGVLGKMAIKAQRYGQAFNCVFFRKEIPMLDDAILRSHEIYGSAGAIWLEQKKTWVFPRGGRLRFRPLERLQDAEKYQGQNITDICIEEAGNYEDYRTIARLHGVLRSAKGVPTQMHLTGNPGGPGQFWIKERYIDPAPNGLAIIKEKLPNGKEKSRIYIPAKVADNRILTYNDPDYVSNLYMVGSDELVRAWLDGDWNAIEGAYFDCWSQNMILRPFELPEHWLRFRSYDWGTAKPFSVGWWAVSSENVYEQGREIPKGSMIRYREWYGKKAANVGLKLDDSEVAKRVKELEKDDTIDYGVADPSIFTRKGGPSTAERFIHEGVRFRHGDNERVKGWSEMRKRMKQNMIYCFSTCVDSIRTIPLLQHDESKAEDLDSDMEDHAADEWRYACMSRPLPKSPPKPAEDQWRKPTWGEITGVMS